MENCFQLLKYSPSFTLCFLWAPACSSGLSDSGCSSFPSCWRNPVQRASSPRLFTSPELLSDLVLQRWQSVLQRLHFILQLRHTLNQGFKAIQHFGLTAGQTRTIHQRETIPLLISAVKLESRARASSPRPKTLVTHHSQADTSHSSQRSQNQYLAVCLGHPANLKIRKEKKQPEGHWLQKLCCERKIVVNELLILLRLRPSLLLSHLFLPHFSLLVSFAWVHFDTTLLPTSSHFSIDLLWLTLPMKGVYNCHKRSSHASILLHDCGFVNWTKLRDILYLYCLNSHFLKLKMSLICYDKFATFFELLKCLKHYSFNVMGLKYIWFSHL